jgi:hypothetical protein
MWKQHTVSAVPLQHCVLRPEFLRDALTPLVSSGVSLADLSPWLGAAARDSARRVVYSPFFCASTGADLDDMATDVERAAFSVAYRALIPEERYLSRSLGLTPATAYRPVQEDVRRAQLANASTRGSYTDWLAAQAMARSVRYADDRDHPTFSFLTTLYSGTDADLLRETARTLFEQTRPFAEWVILVHGPVSLAVEGVVQECASDARVRVLRHADNVGIVRGLRLCLEHASSDYVVPMDADDLVAPDALQVLASEIRSHHPGLIYTDEDTYRDGNPESPFFRPDFDPVLNAENSYIWHLCAYHRDAALRLGVYEDAGAEFCHDWDTICRFARDGGRIGHANHVLYHWRAHPASHSNSGGQHPGSLASTKFVMARTIADQANPGLYEIVPFPIFRGAQEWWIQRIPVSPPSVDALVLGGPPMIEGGSAVERCGFPFQSVHEGEADAPGDWLTRLSKAVESSSEYVLVINGECEDVDQAGIWDAVKLFELHPDVAIVSGRLVNASGVVVACGSVPDEQGRLRSPFNGLKKGDPGPFAMALKAHCILCPVEGLFMVRAPFLASTVQRRPPRLELSALPSWLAACAVVDRVKVAYSPLLQGRTREKAPPIRESSSRAFESFLDELGILRDEVMPGVIGIAGFLEYARVSSLRVAHPR